MMCFDASSNLLASFGLALINGLWIALVMGFMREFRFVRPTLHANRLKFAANSYSASETHEVSAIKHKKPKENKQ